MIFRNIIITFGSVLAIHSQNVLAFTKLKNGFETVTNTYLLPLTGAVAGTALLACIIMSYFKQEEGMKKIAGVFGLTVVAYAGLEILTTLIQSFS